ncbi:MAG: hypothetical protein FH761_04385 [Firmicutes bacterium]|nr:hypothetical protein [Bacillota bacterium]
MKKHTSLIILLLLLTSCKLDSEGIDKSSSLQRENHIHSESVDIEKNASSINVDREDKFIDEQGNTIETRIKTPKGYGRTQVKENSFCEYLRKLHLKPDGSKVLYYNGQVKNREVHVAVIDMDVGERDLQQCADAIMRLRAEYLFEQKKYDKIHFNFTNGFRVDYIKWIQGNRVKVEGNNSYWTQSTDYSNTYEDLREYLNMVFAYAGTLSLSNELTSIQDDDLNIGDVIIQGGSPGHAVIVVDMAENIQSGKKIFLLAQSYMPAQSIHILKNPMNSDLSPWYELNFNDELHTPEWTFDRDDFKRFN